MLLERRTHLPLLLAALLVISPACSPTPQPTPAGLRVFSSNGVKAIIEERRADIERTIDRTLTVDFSTAASLKTRIAGGDTFDVAILTPALIDELAAAGAVDAGSRTDIARAGVGVGVRVGAPIPEIGTSEALKQALLAAGSVAFTAEGQSRATIDRTFARLGIVEAMRPKIVLKGPGEAPAAVAAGEADIVLTLVSEILPVQGLRLVGPLPSELQDYVMFTAARSVNASDTDGAAALLRYLSSEDLAVILPAHGLQPASAAR
jgi:molybdate transport system substrate-binding protein